MTDWLKRLFHHHQWETINIYKRLARGWWADTEWRQVGETHVQRCSVCNKVRSTEV